MSRGFGAPIVSQEIKRYVGLDFYKPHIEFAKNNLEEKNPKYKFYHQDMLVSSNPKEQFDCAFALDVLEHINESDEDIFLKILKNI